MTIELLHLQNARSHAHKEHETQCIALGRALGKLELLDELLELHAMSTPPQPNSDPEDSGPY